MFLDKDDFSSISNLYNLLREAEEKLGRMAAKKSLIEQRIRMQNPELYKALDEVGSLVGALAEQLIRLTNDIKLLNVRLKAKYKVEGEFTIDMSNGEIHPKTKSPSEI